MQIHAVPKKAFKTFFILCASVCLAAFAPTAFAQRGGGSHGGGSHGGGFHGSGASVSMHVSGGTYVSAGRGSAGSSYSSAHGGAGFSPSRFVSSSHPSAEERYGREVFISGAAASTYAATGARAYAANNRLWEDPPAQQSRVGAPAQAPRPVAMPAPVRPVTMPSPNFRAPLSGPMAGGIGSATRPAFHPVVGGVRPMPVIARQLHFAAGSGAALTDPHGPGPYAGMILPALHQLLLHHGFGFGLRPCLVFEPCGFGYGFFGGYGLFGYDDYYYTPYDAEEATEPGVPEDYPGLPDFTAEYFGAAPPFMPPTLEGEAELPATNSPMVELVLNDQTVFPVLSYWLENNRLYYITTYNIKTSIPLSYLDLQKTVDVNYKRGVTFTLTPQPQQKPQDNPQPPDSQQQ